MNGPLETMDMMVVTVRVPTRDASDLAVSVEGAVIHVLGPDGFQHDVPLPDGADADRLHADLFHDVLELRAPRTDSPVAPVTRTVGISALT